MKKEYITAEIEIIQFDKQDLILTSDGTLPGEETPQ